MLFLLLCLMVFIYLLNLFRFFYYVVLLFRKNKIKKSCSRNLLLKRWINRAEKNLQSRTQVYRKSSFLLQFLFLSLQFLVIFSLTQLIYQHVQHYNYNFYSSTFSTASSSPTPSSNKEQVQFHFNN